MLTPSASFDFTSAVLDPRITFARTGATATRVNSSGNIETVAADTARFDFDPITLSCRGLLLEQARLNAVIRSQEFDNATWTGKTNVTTADNTVVSPTGAQNATTFSETSATGGHSMFGDTAVNVTSGTSYTQSVFAKAGTVGVIQLLFAGAAFGTNAFANFDLVNNVVGTVGASAMARMVAYKDGWYRLILTAPATATTLAASFIVAFCNNNTAASRVPTYTGNAANNIGMFGAQFETGSFPTSYIPTTTTAVTRNADVATITGTNFSDWWQAGKGGVLVRARPSTVSGTRPLVQVDDASADNIIALRGNTTNPELYIRAGGSDQATIDAGTISAAAYRLAGAWQAGSAAASLNSGLAVNGAPASIPAVTQMRLGSDGTNYLNGHLQAVEYWPVRLSNASLQNASSTAGYQSIIHPVSRDTIITEPV